LSADVEVGFNIKEFGSDDEVIVTARGTTGQTFETVTTRSEAGRFSATMTLPLQDNYTLTFTSRGTNVISGNLMELNIANIFCDRFRFSFGVGMSTTHATHRNQASSVITFSPHLINFTERNSLLEISSISIFALSSRVAIQEWDLLPYLRAGSDMQIIEGSELWEWDRFQIPFTDNADEPVDAVRLVIYDNLGIRYELMEHLPVRHLHASGAGVDWAGASTVAFSQYPNRIIRYGEDSWHFIHMVLN
jgi:hypothetical protein